MHISKKSCNFAADFALMAEIEEHIVELKTLEVGRYNFDFQLDSSCFTSIEKSELLGGFVRVIAQLNLRANDYDLTLSVIGKVDVTCDRCLEPVSLEVDATEEMAPLLDNVNVIDLNWLAYEQIVVNLPLVRRHPEGGCNPEMAALLQRHLCSTEQEPETL